MYKTPFHLPHQRVILSTMESRIRSENDLEYNVELPPDTFLQESINSSASAPISEQVTPNFDAASINLTLRQTL